MELRQARLFDDMGPNGQAPTHSRAPVPESEIDAVVNYLNSAPIVLSARGFDRDLLDPEGKSNVPLTFHTDGTWVWAGAVGYYLRVHGVPPEPDLLAHVRSHGFRVPDVDEHTRNTAV